MPISSPLLKKPRLVKKLKDFYEYVKFNDGNVEAVMAVYKYKDGKIISLETGATKIW